MGLAHLLATLVKAHLWACLLKHTKSTLWFNEKLSMHGKVWLHLMRRSDAKLPKSVYHSLGSDLGCVCFGWKSFSEMLFRKCGCLVGLENSIFRKLISVDPKKKGFDYGNEFPFLFSLQMNSWERERERARGRQRPSRRSSHVQAPVGVVRKHQRRRSRSEIANSPSRRSQSARCFTRSRSTLREIAPSIAISRSGAVLHEIAIDGAVVGLERAVEPSWSRASIWVLCLFF